MKQAVLQQAVGRLRLAERAVQSLIAVGEDPIEFQVHWLDFLVQWKGAYTKIQQAAKDTPQELQWFGGVNRERKTDPLLRYLFEARNDGEHGIEASARHSGPGSEWRAKEHIVNPTLHIGADGHMKFVGPGGQDVAEYVRPVPAESYLIEVSEYDGKKKVPPPTEHLGQPMEAMPLIAADLGLRWLEALVATAGAMRTA